MAKRSKLKIKNRDQFDVSDENVIGPRHIVTVPSHDVTVPSHIAAVIIHILIGSNENLRITIHYVIFCSDVEEIHNIDECESSEYVMCQ